MFSFDKEYIISNKIVELSLLKESHTDLLFPQSNHKDIWKYFTENGYGKTNFEKYISKAIYNRIKGIEYPLVIKDLRTNEYAGITRIYDVNNTLGNVKIGHTWIGKKFQGTGLNKNCKFVLFGFLFDQLHMKRIGFGASSENVKSIAAMESVGCTQEGKLRSILNSADGQGRVDIVLLSILFDEWKSHVKQNLKSKLNLIN